MMNGHSILSPSSAGTWGKPGGCTGSVKMRQQYPEPEEWDEDRERGTASHEVGERLIRIGMKTTGQPEFKVGDKAPNGILIDDEIIEAATVYANDFLMLYKARHYCGLLMTGIETRVDVTNVHPECWGTPDAWLYDKKANELHVWDYKFGRLFVDEFENRQLLCYAAGLGLRCNIPQDCSITLTVVQPRAYSGTGPVRRWSLTTAQLVEYTAQLNRGASEATSDAAQLRTRRHCLYCSALHVCPPALQQGIGLFELAARPVPQELSPGALGLQLTIVERAVKQLEKLKEAYEEQIKVTMKNGKDVPGWRLQPSTGREEWNLPTEQVINTGKLLGVDLSRVIAITPNQARQKGMHPDTVAGLASRRDTGFKLKRDTGAAARRCFTFNEDRRGL